MKTVKIRLSDDTVCECEVGDEAFRRSLLLRECAEDLGADDSVDLKSIDPQFFRTYLESLHDPTALVDYLRLSEQHVATALLAADFLMDDVLGEQIDDAIVRGISGESPSVVASPVPTLALAREIEPEFSDVLKKCIEDYLETCLLWDSPGSPPSSSSPTRSCTDHVPPTT